MSSLQAWVLISTLYFFVKAAVSTVVSIEKDRPFCAFAAVGWAAWAGWAVSLNS